MDVKKIAIIVGLAMTAGTIIGAVYKYDQCLARKAEVQLVAKRLDQKIVWDKIDRIQQRIWDLERHYGGIGVPAAPQPVKDEYRYLIQEKKRLERAMKP